MSTQKKRKTTELIFTIVGTALAGGLGTGLIPPDIFEFGKTVLEAAQASASTGASDTQIIVDVIYKGISILTGGLIISSYSKSRAQVKSAEATNKPAVLNE